LRSESCFFGKEYIAALQKHYPELVEGERRSTIDRELHLGFVDRWMRDFDAVGVDAPNRFQRITERPWAADQSAWAVSGGGNNLRNVGAYGSYKGLINLKPAIDLVLYSNLIWELRPQTILEFGSLQGGSACWFADQLDALCGGGEVHSFELCYKCISHRAIHPRLAFHQADLRDLRTLDRNLFGRLPHPWLAVDDAHENLSNLVPFVAGFMKPGDYYVIEDAFMYPTASSIEGIVRGCENMGFLVDSKYTDAFGINVTCSPNGWLVKAVIGGDLAGAGPPL
jgi:cephalosporin hydroxylase